MLGHSGINHREEGSLTGMSPGGGGRGLCLSGLWVWAVNSGSNGDCWHTGWKLGWGPQTGLPACSAWGPHIAGEGPEDSSISLDRHPGFLGLSLPSGVFWGQWQEESGRAHDAREGLCAAATLPPTHTLHRPQPPAGLHDVGQTAEGQLPKPPWRAGLDFFNTGMASR